VCQSGKVRRVIEPSDDMQVCDQCDEPALPNSPLCMFCKVADREVATVKAS
jgi:hypothetical protein